MPNYRLLTREQRRALIGTLTSAVEQDPRYAQYLAELRALNEEMDRLSRTETERGRPDAGMPHDLTAEEARNLQSMLMRLALQGETLLAAAEQPEEEEKAPGGMSERDDESEGPELPGEQEEGGLIRAKQTVPELLSRMQDMLARDYDVLGAYDGRPPRSLPEIQDAGRTLTVDLRGRRLDTIGGTSSSRLPMTVVDSSGKKRSGFFTRASRVRIMDVYNGPLNKAKALCGEEGQDALDHILSQIKLEAIRSGMPKGDGRRVRMMDADEIFVGFLYIALQNYDKKLRPREESPFAVRVEFQPKEIKSFLKEIGVETEKISGAALQVLTEGFNELGNKPSVQIMSQRLLLKDGARLDSRNSAMSAVASLLGVPKLLARSDPMRCIGEDGKVIEGTFMEYADGHDLFGNQSLLVGVQGDPFKSEASRKSLNRQIADLQVLDFLCLNEDRHPGNLVYQVDRNGMITGIQGIDNDCSFARRVPKMNELQSLRVISEKMRDTVMALTPDMLRFALRGHDLQPEEIDAAVGRLKLLQEAIETKKLEVVSDEKLAESAPKDLASEEPHRNLFCRLDESVDEFVPRVHGAYGFGYRLSRPETPELTNVQTDDRVFTVGSLKDSLRAVSRLYKNKETGFRQSDLVNSHGKSGNFKKLMKAVKRTSELQKRLFESGTSHAPSDGVSLNEVPALSLRRQTDEAFDQLEKLANAYLEGKREERHALSVDTIKAKNPYEQSHIDHAKNVLKAVAEYRQKTAEPESEQAREAQRAQADKDALDQMRVARELAQQIQKIDQARKERQQNQLGGGQL